MSEYKLDLNNYTEEKPEPITYEMFNKLIKERNRYKAERDTLIDDVTILKANNDRLIRRNEKLEAYVRMWEKLTKWKQGKLKECCNNDLLHELIYTMNELERDMYKGRG